MRDGELDIHHAAVWIRELEKPPLPDPHITPMSLSPWTTTTELLQNLPSPRSSRYLMRAS